MRLGVSVVVCCHNSAARLPETLAHLAAQESAAGGPWEVIVVDNASTDNTAGVALAEWPVDSPAPLRVVTERTLGLSHARIRGLSESTYGLVSFVDDDNWVCPEWVRCASELMSSRPEVGACGGQIEAVCEVPPPRWFDRYKGCYAIGAQGNQAGDITGDRGYLWGAGLTVRKSAILRLLSGGFQFLMMGREGTTLTAGEDAELCCALRLAGWRLWYEPRLRMRHYVPATRLKWDYLRSLMRGFGASSAGLDGYLDLLDRKPIPIMGTVRWSWLWSAFVASARLGGLMIGHPVALFRRSEGCPTTLRAEWQLGRIQELLKLRNTYHQALRRIQEAAWR